MTGSRPRWTRCLLTIAAVGMLPVFPARCTSDLLTGSLTGAADTATDIAFDGLRSLLATGDPADSVVDFALNLTETMIDESAGQAIDRAVPDDPIYD